MEREINVRIHQQPEYTNTSEMKGLSGDEEQLFELLGKLNNSSGYEVHFHPKSFCDTDGCRSKIEVNLCGHYEFSVYFLEGRYETWIFCNHINKQRSGNKDKENFQKALEKITDIIEHYKLYEEANYQISKYVDTVYY